MMGCVRARAGVCQGVRACVLVFVSGCVSVCVVVGARMCASRFVRACVSVRQYICKCVSGVC